MELLRDDPWDREPRPYSIEDAVARKLTREGFDAEDVAIFIGTLVQNLHEDGIINDELVLRLLPGFKKYTGAPNDT
jgi:hypothetical protein